MLWTLQTDNQKKVRIEYSFYGSFERDKKHKLNIDFLFENVKRKQKNWHSTKNQKYEVGQRILKLEDQDADLLGINQLE